MIIEPGHMTIAGWRDLRDGTPATLDPATAPRIAESAAAVTRILAQHTPVYGINTGFGKLASVRIDDADLTALQRNIVLSHAAGVGEPMPVPIARLMMGLKLASLARGASGVRPATVALLEAMLHQHLVPVVPAESRHPAAHRLAARFLPRSSGSDPSSGESDAPNLAGVGKFVNKSAAHVFVIGQNQLIVLPTQELFPVFSGCGTVWAGILCGSGQEERWRPHPPDASRLKS